jgi:hypothetical protein
MLTGALSKSTFEAFRNAAGRAGKSKATATDGAKCANVTKSVSAMRLTGELPQRIKELALIVSSRIEGGDLLLQFRRRREKRCPNKPYG